MRQNWVTMCRPIMPPARYPMPTPNSKLATIDSTRSRRSTMPRTTWGTNAARTDRGRITAGIKSANGTTSRGTAYTTHSQFDSRPSCDRTGGTMDRTATNPTSAAAVAIRVRSGVNRPAGFTIWRVLVDRVLDVIDPNQAPVADREADHVEADWTPVPLHL